MPKALKIALFLLFSCFVVFSSGVIHEYGHAFTALACGAQVDAAGIAPGIIIYPKLDFYHWQPWNDPIAWCAYVPPEAPWKAGLCDLMGSGATTIVGYLVLLAIFVFRPTRWKWAALAMIVIVYTGDLPLYAILPRLGLRHFIVFGGTNPEPLLGALAMGIPEWAFFILVAFDILLVCSLLTYSVLRLRRRSDQAKNQIT